MNAVPPLFIYAFLMSAIVYCLCAEMSVIFICLDVRRLY